VLAAAPEIPRVPRAHVRTLEISSEGLDQVVPVGDLRGRQMLQPCPGSVEEEKGEVADDEVVVARSSQLARQPVIRKPQLRPCLPCVLGDGSRGSEPGRERRPSYGPVEDSQTWWFGRGAPILLTIVASSAPGVVASAHSFLEAGSTVAAVLFAAEAVRGLQASRPVCARCGPRPPACVGRTLRDAPRGTLAFGR
jgi:hypothetical protein